MDAIEDEYLAVMNFWPALTDFGDSALMVPAILAIALWLLTIRAWWMSLCWLGFVGIAIGLVALTKIAFIGWGLGIQSLNFTGISGHATLAMSVLPLAGWLLSSPRSRMVRIALTLACILGALLIGVSRIGLGYHSMAEVVTGIVLGGLVSGGLIMMARRSQPHALRHRWIPGLLILVLLISGHGHRAPSEHLLTAVALFVSGHTTPYQRWRPLPPPAAQSDEVIGIR